jgi:hypothetical protein
MYRNFLKLMICSNLKNIPACKVENADWLSWNLWDLRNANHSKAGK